MKRDMDLVREILLKVEGDAGYQALMEVDLDGYSRDEVAYHVKLLAEAGLIEAVDASCGGGHIEWRVNGLTWAGHEFVDSCRDEAVWQQAKREVAEKAKGITFAVLSTLLIELARKSVFGT